MKRQAITDTTVEVTAVLSLMPRRVETRAVRASRGESVGSVCAKAFPGFRASHYAAGGADVEGSSSLKGARSVICWRTPEASAVIGFAAMMVTGIVVGGIIDAAFSKKTKTKYNKQTADLSDEQYGWDYDSQNAVAEGAPIPALYGRRMVLPPVIQQHSHNRLDTGEGFAELVYAVAEGGGGFGDTIVYPLDSDNKIQALLDHTSWVNYNSESMTGQDEVRNVAFGITAMYGNASFDGTTVTGNNTVHDDISFLCDGITSSLQSAYMAEAFPPTEGVQNAIFKVANCFPKECHVYSYFGTGTGQGIAGFTLYGWDGTQWLSLGSTTTWTGLSFMKCSLLLQTDARYTYYKISSFLWRRDASHGTYGRQNMIEVELWGKTASGETIPGGYCAITANAGTYGQFPSELTTQTWAKLGVNKKLDKSFFVFSTTPKASPNRLNMHIEFPYGLYAINSGTGEIQANPVAIQAQFRTVASDGTRGSWAAYFNSSHATSEIVVSGDTATISKFSQDSIKLDFEIDGLSGADHYEIQAKIANNPSITDNSECTCSWTGLDEGWSFTCAYPRTATATMKLLASETLSGEIPQFKILAERATLNIWNPIAGQWQEKAASNPAWAAWDVIVHPVFDDRNPEHTANSPDVLLREQYDHTAIAYSEFAAWAAFCDEEGITCSLYYDAQTDVQTALSYLCEIGRAAIVNRGGTLGVAVDRAIDTPAYIFNHLNIVADSFKEEYIDTTKLPDEIEVTFFDREREWERFTVTAGSAIDGKEPAVESVTLYACDRRDVAEAYAKWKLERSMIKRHFQWTGDMDALPCDVGDVVWVYGDMVRITSATYDAEHRRVFAGEEYVPERFDVPPIRVAATIIVSRVINEGYFYVDIPALPEGKANTIDWGDGGEPEEFTQSGVLSHAYAATGNYSVEIRAYRVTNMQFRGYDGRDPAHSTKTGTRIASLSILNLMDIVDASYMFNLCKYGQNFSLPEGTAFWKAKTLYYFAGNSRITNLSKSFAAPRAATCKYAFVACNQLYTFPENIILNSCNVENMFYYSRNMAGVVPASQFWGNPNITNHSYCFFNSTSLTNYSEIPSDWK